MTPEDLLKQVEEHMKTAAAAQGGAVLEAVVKHLAERYPVPGPGAGPMATFGQQIATNEAFKQWIKDGETTGRFGNFGPVKINHPIYSMGPEGYLPPLLRGGVTEAEQKDVTASQFPVASTVLPFAPFPRRRFRVRDLIPVAGIGTPKVDYARITGFSNNAATQIGEGALKGQSEITTELVTETAQMIATFMPVSRQALMNVPGLRAWLDATMEYFLTLEEDRQLLNGTGVNSLRGILNVPGVLTLNRGTDTHLDAIRKGITDIQTSMGSGTNVSGFDPTGIVLHPDDAETLDLQKDGNNRYLLIPEGGPPVESGVTSGRRIWALAPVVTPAMMAGTALLGAFDIGSTLLIYEGLQTRVTDSHSDFFRRNLLAFLVEYQAMHPIYFPKAYLKLVF